MTLSPDLFDREPVERYSTGTTFSAAGPFGPLNQIEFDRVAFGEASEAITLNRRVVNETISFALRRGR